MKNITKYYTEFSLWTVVILFITGGITQTFFAEIGLSESQISLISTGVNIAQIVMMILNIFISDIISNLKRTISLLKLSPILFFAALLPFCRLKAVNTTIFFYIAISVTCIFNLFLGFYNVLSYRFIYQITDIKNYATISNVSIIISSILTVLISALISFTSSLFPFRRIMMIIFIICILLAIATSVITAKLEIINPDSTVKEKKKFDFSMLLTREFTYFYLPNFMRGCANGIMSIISVICIKNITDNPTVLSSLVTVYYIASIVGSLLYQFVVKKIKTGTIYALSSVFMFLFLPLSLIGSSTPVFIIFYAAATIFYIIIASANAVYFAEIIDYKKIGTYTAVRLIIMTLGQAAAGLFVAFAIDKIPSVFILIAGGTCQLISGIMLYLYKPKK